MFFTAPDSNEENEVPGFIDDSYTRTEIIPARTGHHEAVTITYRPCNARERYRLYEGMPAYATLTADQQFDRQAKVLVEKVKSWDLKNGDADVPLKLESFSGIDFALFEAMVALVAGYKTVNELEAAAKN